MPSGRKRVLTIGAAAGSLGLLAAVALLLWSSDAPDYGLAPGRYQPDGETVGWVSKVESNVIHVNPGPFGGGVVPLVVTRATRIMVGAKEGWVGDIRPGGQVRVAYELHQGRRFARSVELLVDEGARRPVRARPARPSAPVAPATVERDPAQVPSAAAPSGRPAPPPRAARPTAATTPGAASSTGPRPVSTTAKPTAPVSPAAAAEARPAEAVTPPARAPAATPGAATPEPTRAVEAPRPAASRPAETIRGAQSGEPADGSAAVDWLLQGRR